TFNGQTFRITYVGGDGNDIVVTAIDGPIATTTLTYFVPEGTTGPLFDEDILTANPTTTAAPVTVTFTKDSGEQVVATRTVPALARLTLHVDELRALEAS